MGILIGSEEIDKKFNPEDKELVENAVRRVLKLVGAGEIDYSLGIDGAPVGAFLEDKDKPLGFNYITAALEAYQELIGLREKEQIKDEEEFLVKKIKQQRLLNNQ